MKINKYIKIVNKNDYYGFYKLLKKDYKEIQEKLNQISMININNEKTYFNLIISLWNCIKYNELDSIDLDAIYNANLNYNFQYDTYDSYYSKNIERIYMKNTDNNKINITRKYNYIHQKVIERLILEELKKQFNINQKDIIREFFLNRIIGSTERFVDCYGNYGDIRMNTCYFFDIFILTNTALIYKPLTVRYEQIYIDEINFKIINFNEINSINFRLRSIDIIFKNNDVFQIKFTRNSKFLDFKKELVKQLNSKSIQISCI